MIPRMPIVCLLVVLSCWCSVLSAGYDYKLRADDWKSMDGTWCASTEQTPIDVMRTSELSSYGQMPRDFFPDLKLPSVSGVYANNNGHNVNFQFPATPSATLRYPTGKTFTALHGAYTGTGQSGPAPPQQFVKDEFNNSGPNTPQEVRSTLLDLHWHVPSEHSVSGRLFPAEAHFVHYVQRDNDPDCTYNGNLCLVVFGVLYDVVVNNAEVPVNPGFSKAMDRLMNLPGYQEDDTAALASVDFNEFLPENKEFWHYRGSLTTPGCNENVTWYLLQKPAHMVWDHYAKLRYAILYPALGNTNARPPLPLNQRVVLASDYEAHGDYTHLDESNRPCKISANVESAETIPCSSSAFSTKVAAAFLAIVALVASAIACRLGRQTRQTRYAAY